MIFKHPDFSYSFRFMHEYILFIDSNSMLAAGYNFGIVRRLST